MICLQYHISLKKLFRGQQLKLKSMSSKGHKSMEDYDEKFIDSLDSSIYFRFCSGNINAEEFRQSRLEFENDNVEPNA